MSYSENGGTQFTMPVAPYGGYFGGGNDGFLGGNGAWWLIILLLFCNNGWGGFGFGGGGGVMPWMMNNTTNNDVQRGFDQSAIMGSLTGITSAINNGFANAEISRCNSQANVLQTLNANQAATLQSMNSIAAGLQNCCCENRAGLADLKYTVATENCADRTAAAQNTRDIIDAQTRGTQAILDKLCALELDGVKGQLAQAQRENVGLQNQLNIATMQASQTAQNAFIQQGFANEVDALYNRLNSCPVPTTPVYGRTPIFTCSGNNMGCGCAGNAFAN